VVETTQESVSCFLWPFFDISKGGQDQISRKQEPPFSASSQAFRASQSGQTQPLPFPQKQAIDLAPKQEEEARPQSVQIQMQLKRGNLTSQGNEDPYGLGALALEEGGATSQPNVYFKMNLDSINELQSNLETSNVNSVAKHSNHAPPSHQK